MQEWGRGAGAVSARGVGATTGRVSQELPCGPPAAGAVAPSLDSPNPWWLRAMTASQIATLTRPRGTAHMTTTATSPRAATPVQLRYVKRLAEQAGQTVALPHSRQQASALIRQLQTTISQGGGAAEREAEAARDREAVIADLRIGAGDTTRFQPDETTGYGVRARWASAESRDEIISSHPIPVRLIPNVGPRKQLARCTTAQGHKRILWGRRIDGVVRVTDRPASDRIGSRDRAHVVATNLTSRREMDAAISAWLREAKRLGVVPAEAIPYDHFVARLREQA
jgi:hypothetical protein